MTEPQPGNEPERADETTENTEAPEAGDKVREVISAGEKLRKSLDFWDQILKGDVWYADYAALNVDTQGDDPELPYSGGVVVDFNDTLSAEDRDKAQGWIRGKLGDDPENVPVSHHYVSPDGATHIRRFAHPLNRSEDSGEEGGNEGWFLAQMQTNGEDQVYLLQQEDWYDMQVEGGYTLLENPN